MPTIYKVLGNVADKPESFGELGTLGVFCIAPPIDIGDFRCIPQMSVAFWTTVLPPLKEMPNWPDSYTPIGAEEIPEGLADTTKIGSSLVFRHQGSSHTNLQSLVVDGRLVMAVSFENSKLQFRLVSITSSKLGDWWDVYDFRELTKEIGPDCEQVFHGGIQKPGWETYKATGASVVGIGMASERHLADSVLRTLKKKGSWVSKKGQMPDGECGVIAIGLGECSRSGAEQVMKTVVKRFEKFHKSVSVVMLLWDERTSEQFLTSKIDTFCIPVRNKFADCPLPTSVLLPTGLVRRVGITTEPGPMRDK